MLRKRVCGCVCAGGAEEQLKRSSPCGIDPRERVLLWMERGREGHWMSHAEGVTMDGPTVFASLPPSRFALWRDKSPRQEGP